MQMAFDIGIDLGSYNIRACDARGNIILDAPCAIARCADGQILAIGDEALALLGREPSGASVIFPLVDALPESPAGARDIIAWAMRALPHRRRGGDAILLSCAPFMRGGYRSALMNAALDAGAAQVTLARSDALAAIGAGGDIMSPKASFIIDIGAGKATATLFALGREVATAHTAYGLSRINARIIERMRRDFAFVIGEATAEEVKLALSFAGKPADGAPPARALGLDLLAREPKPVEISAEIVYGAMVELLNDIARISTAVVSAAPAEMFSDISIAGAQLVGGGAHIPGIVKFIEATLGVPATIPNMPELACARGISAVALEPERYKDALYQGLTQVKL
jgi:rod shape-determining protein MreB